MSYQGGDWNATCFLCGAKRKASTLKKHWKGYWVCENHWEERHTQDYVRPVQDVQTVPWSQPQWNNDIHIYVCDINGRSAIPALAIGGCMMPGNAVHNLELDSPTIPPLCDIYSSQGVPGWGGPGCAVPGFDPMVA